MTGAEDGLIGGRPAAAGVGHGGRGVERQQHRRRSRERAARIEARVEPVHPAGTAAAPQRRAGRPRAGRAHRPRQLRPRLQGCVLRDV